MKKTITAQGDVDDDGTLRLRVATGLPAGPVEVVLTLVRNEDDVPVVATSAGPVRMPTDEDLAADLQGFDEEVKKKAEGEIGGGAGV